MSVKPYYTDGMRTIYCGDCREILPSLGPSLFDLVLTSPPYGSLREYGGHGWEFDSVARAVVNAMGDGSILVWIVGDDVVDGSETGTSFRQALEFKNLGLRLHDTMIYWKNAFPFPESTRYAQVFEFMFVLSKGAPQKTNILRVPMTLAAEVREIVQKGAGS